MRSDPICDHARTGIVSSGSADGPHAATNVCSRDECIADAMEWASAMTGLSAWHRFDREPDPTLFDAPSSGRSVEALDDAFWAGFSPADARRRLHGS